MRKVLDVTQENGLQFKWSKCQFFMSVVEYLGYEIGHGSLRPSKLQQAEILKFPEPSNVRQAQRFLGLTGYFRKYVKNYAVIAKPLTDLLRKDAEFKFDQRQREAVRELKTILTSEPVLQLYSTSAITELHTDACKIGLGAVMLHRRHEVTSCILLLQSENNALSRKVLQLRVRGAGDS